MLLHPILLVPQLSNLLLVPLIMALFTLGNVLKADNFAGVFFPAELLAQFAISQVEGRFVEVIQRLKVCSVVVVLVSLGLV